MKRSTFLLFAVFCATCFNDAVRGSNSNFRRGDSNLDGALDVSNAIQTLFFLFLGVGRPLRCEDAADSNDDGKVDITDPVYSLGFLFLGRPPPPPPFGECSPDPTRDALGCAAFAGCEPPRIFGEPASYDAGFGNLPSPTTGDLALGDLDGDGALDLAVVNQISDKVSILLGHGDGTFGEAAGYGAGGFSFSVALGDLDGDGALDE
ncbi:MAG: VCBS repeat-containing protein [Planctomycetes bacterium]|nr:VCBS repeat-containing protein [Planctomycetota bacterium]